ncbi:MAG TPA: pentapeptide repeat-containing protein, partial [Terrimesophilobacter sp.]|nr:pentapeptide repeat-containing protein [Terrimesophilobacter sp.]
RLHAPLIANRRVATRDVELGGRMIRAGERVNVNWASANRDEVVFGGADLGDTDSGGADLGDADFGGADLSNAERFRPEEHAAENLLYGRGIHDCPGAPLARLELRVVIEELLAATDTISMPAAAQPDYAVYPASGFRTLHIRVG